MFGKALDEDIVNRHDPITLSVETFSYLLESNSFKKFLHLQHTREFNSLLVRLVSILRSSINDKLRSVCLSCLSEAISVEPNLLASQERTDEKWTQSEFAHKTEWHEMCLHLYEAATSELGHEALFNMCLTMAKQPFVDKRLAAQIYFKAMAQSRWGLMKLFEPNRFNSDENFVSGYLVNRSVELEKQGLESKYELIRLLVATLEANGDLIKLVADGFEKMKAYVQEGPFFGRAQAQVAFESN